mgnify:CR=1 FL=1
MINEQEPKYYIATFRPAWRTSDLVYPIQFGVLARTRKEARKKARIKVEEEVKAGKLEAWRTGSLRLKELAD